MKFLPLVASCALAALNSAFAITDAEITPAALVGKTLTFTIDNADGAFADTGSWTGTFGTTSFVVANGPNGNTVGITTTHSTVQSGFTTVTLPEYISGSGTTTITLFTDKGIGKYEMNFKPLDFAFQIGSFTIGTAAAKGPEIDVRLAGRKIQDNVGTKDIGVAVVGKSVSKVFKIENNGNSLLKNLGITITGENKNEFTAIPLKKDKLDVGESVEFKVTFKPKNFGTRKAVIRIKSNDKNENPIDIRNKGTGTL